MTEARRRPAPRTDEPRPGPGNPYRELALAADRELRGWMRRRAEQRARAAARAGGLNGDTGRTT